MTEDLAKMSCEECRAGTPKMTNEEIEELHKQILGWLIVSRDGVLQLQREYPFGNFVGALAFTMVIAALAEREKHYPALVTEWGNVRVNWCTPQIGGLHRNDFIMAAKIDRACQEDLQSRPDPLEDLPIVFPSARKMHMDPLFLKGFREGLQQSLLQKVLIDIVRARFPGLAEFAEHQAIHFNKPYILEQLIQQVAIAPDAATVRKLLASEAET